MDTPQSPASTILVKKADGTYTRLSKASALAGEKKVAVPTPTPTRTPAPAPARATQPTQVKKSREWDSEDHASLLDPEFHATPPNPSAPSSLPKPVIKSSTPQMAKSAVPPVAVAKSGMPPALDRMIRASASESMGGLSGLAAKRPLVRDIEVAKPLARVSMGPVDELRAFTLTDWRRLGPDVTKAGEEVWKKFAELQAESYILFLDGVRAWHDSPLYREYLDALTKALTTGVTIEQSLSQGTAETLKPQEWTAILALGSKLS